MIESTISALLALIVVGLAAKKWHILRDRNSIAAVIRIALKDRKALYAGTILGIFYLAIFFVWGGKGGRVHLLFGRLIWNTTASEALTGLILGLLVMVSVTLIAYSVHVAGMGRSGTEKRIGLAGTFLALLACFCP